MRWLFFVFIILSVTLGSFSPNICFCEERLGQAAVEEEFVYNSGKKRDPFMPLVTSDGRYLYGMPSIDTGKGGDIVLEGILKDSRGEYFAIISGEMVKKGDKFKGLDVVEIRENRVRLSKDGEEKIYKLTEEGGGVLEEKNAVQQ